MTQCNLAEQAAEGREAPQRQLGHLEGVKRLAHSRPCPGCGEAPALAEKQDVTAHAAQEGQRPGARETSAGSEGPGESQPP